jgi:hypothetical protein
VKAQLRFYREQALERQESANVDLWSTWLAVTVIGLVPFALGPA